ncbi:unnamed protein product [Chrysoparadoxa australica]
MARGTLKNVKRSRAEKGATKSSAVATLQAQDLSSEAAAIDYWGAWLNCECLFSLLLVGLLAALPFNLHANDLLQTREGYATRAADLFHEGSYEQAAHLYERAIAAEETAEGHAYLAETLMKVGRAEEAIRHYYRAADMHTDASRKAAVLSSLGKLQGRLGRPDQAVQSYTEVLGLQSDEESPEAAEAHVQVALSLAQDGWHEKALKHFEEALELSPSFVLGHLLLANTLLDMGQVNQAVARYKRVTMLRPHDFAGLSALGFAYHELGDFTQALAYHSQALAVTTRAQGSPITQYAMAALQGKVYGAYRAPSAYVATLFDLVARKEAYRLGQQRLHGSAGGALSEEEVAEEEIDGGDNGSHFKQVHGLVYEGIPEVMMGMVLSALGLADWHMSASDNPGTRQLRWFDTLDVGCGTGAMGYHLRPLSNKLVGIDVSSDSVNISRRKGFYDELIHADAVTALKGIPPGSLDLVTAADLVPYYGDISGLLRAVAATLRPGGMLLINADMLRADEGGARNRFALRFTGRWGHGEGYLQEQVEKHGLEVVEASLLEGYSNFISSGEGVATRVQKRQRSHTQCMLLRKKVED